VNTLEKERCHKPVVIAIHGTGDTANGASVVEGQKPHWWQADSPFYNGLTAYISADQFDWECLTWSGENSDKERRLAAQKLARTCGHLSSQGREYAILAHSHGGTATDIAFGEYASLAGQPDHCKAVVSYGAPFFKSSRKIGLSLAPLFKELFFGILLFWLLFYSTSYPSIHVKIISWIVLIGVPAYFFFSGYKFLKQIGKSASSKRAWRSGLGREKWLAIISKWDEVMGLLPKASVKHSLPYVSRTMTEPGIKYFFILISFASWIATYYALYYHIWPVSWQWPWLTTAVDHIHHFSGGDVKTEVYDIYPISTNTKTFLVNLTNNRTLPILVGITVFTFLYLWFYPLTLFISWAINGTVHGILRRFAYGSDDTFKLLHVRDEPQYFSSEVQIIDRVEFGNLKGDHFQKLINEFYINIITFRNQNNIIRDNNSILDTFFDSIYHNAYFDDELVIKSTAQHIANRLHLRLSPLRGDNVPPES